MGWKNWAGSGNGNRRDGTNTRYGGTGNNEDGNKTPCGGIVGAGNINQRRKRSRNRGRERSITRFPVLAACRSRPDHAIASRLLPRVLLFWFLVSKGGVRSKSKPTIECARLFSTLGVRISRALYYFEGCLDCPKHWGLHKVLLNPFSLELHHLIGTIYIYIYIFYLVS